MQAGSEDAFDERRIGCRMCCDRANAARRRARHFAYGTRDFRERPVCCINARAGRGQPRKTLHQPTAVTNAPIHTLRSNIGIDIGEQAPCGIAAALDGSERQLNGGNTMAQEKDVTTMTAGGIARPDDMTLHKQAEEVLLKAGALQRAIFNSANFSSIATDARAWSRNIRRRRRANAGLHGRRSHEQNHPGRYFRSGRGYRARQGTEHRARDPDHAGLRGPGFQGLAESRTSTN